MIILGFEQVIIYLNYLGVGNVYLINSKTLQIGISIGNNIISK